MSKNIRNYLSSTGDMLMVTAFVGSRGNASIQFTLRNQRGYIALSEVQVKDLIKILQKRLDREPGYQATDGGEGELMDHLGVLTEADNP